MVIDTRFRYNYVPEMYRLYLILFVRLICKYLLLNNI